MSFVNEYTIRQNYLPTSLWISYYFALATCVKAVPAEVEVLRPFRQQNVLMETCHERGKCAWEVPLPYAG